MDLNKVYNTEKLRGASLLVEKMDDIAARDETKQLLESETGGNRYERELIGRDGEVRRDNALNINNRYWREQKIRIGRLNNVRIFLKLNAKELNQLQDQAKLTIADFEPEYLVNKPRPLFDRMDTMKMLRTGESMDLRFKDQPTWSDSDYSDSWYSDEEDYEGNGSVEDDVSETYMSSEEDTEEYSQPTESVA